MTQISWVRSRALAALPAALLLMGSFAAAGTITVKRGGDLQAAVDAAKNGDTILVEPGEYLLNQALDFNRERTNPAKNLFVRSTAGAEQTVLRLAASSDPQRASVAVFQNGEMQGSVLEGFTLTGGRGFGQGRRGGGIYCEKSNPTIKSCVITGNTADWGAGIYVTSCVPLLINCVISSNAAAMGGGGMFTSDPNDAASPSVKGCKLFENTAPKGGALFSSGSSRTVLEGCMLWGNRAEQGGAIFSQDSSYPEVINCLVVGNSAQDGGGILTQGTSYPYVTNSTIADNFAKQGGGVAATGSSYPRLTNSIAWGNAGGSFVSLGQSYPQLNNSCVDGPPQPGSKNISSDPLFLHSGSVDTRGTPDDPFDDVTTLGDYHLRARSAAVDAGTPQAPSGNSTPTMAPKTDLEGKARPCWREFDMGAYEYCGQEVPGPIPDIVFVSRLVEATDTEEPNSPVARARQGSLLLYRPMTSEIVPLVDAAAAGAPAIAPRDILDPDVSFDGKRIVFSGYSEEEGAWRIYEIGADGSGLRQVTRSDRQLDIARYGAAGVAFERYDDMDPCYVADGKICFVSTRYPESAPEGRLRATNLYLVDSNGAGLRRLTSERFGADTPAVDPTTGNVVFSRWWRTPEVRSGSGVINPSLPPENPETPAPPSPPAVPPGSPAYGNQVDVPPPPNQIDPSRIPRPSLIKDQPLFGVPEESFPGVNSWFLASLRLDGTDLAMVSGFHLDRVATQAYRPTFLPDGRLLALFLTETPRAGVPGVFGLRRYQRGPTFPEFLGGPQDFKPSTTPFRYHSAVALPDGRLLVSGARKDGLLGGRFDVFVQENSKDAAPAHLFGLPDRAEMDAVPVVTRPVPRPGALPDTPPPVENAPRDAEEAARLGGTFTFQVANIFANAEVDVALPNAPPIGKRLFIEFYMVPQRTSLLAADPPVLLNRLEVPPSGKFEVELPAGVPLFEMLRRPDGTIAAGRDGQIFHVGGLNFGTPGKTATCVGCHAGHSMMKVPDDATFTNVAPGATVTATSSRKFGDLISRPVLLVDRRTDFFRSEWVAALDDREPIVRLTWGAPIQAREVVLYAPSRGPGVFGKREMFVLAVTIRTYLDHRHKDTLTFRKPLEPTGTKIPLSMDEIDSLEVDFIDYSGMFEGQRTAALSEIEVIGRGVEGALPQQSFIRGDADCDAEVDITDSVVLLGSLFLGEGSLCCSAGADANGDGASDLSDSIFLLTYLFRGGSPPAAPFPRCGSQAEGGLSCDQEACR